MKYVARMYAKNVVGDWVQNLKNIVGGRLTGYEEMVQKAIDETLEEYKQKYGQGRIQDIIVREFSNESILVIIYGQ